MSDSFNRVKVYPVETSWERALEEPIKIPTVKPKKCLCELIFFCFNNCKIFGLAPFTRKSHDTTKPGTCQFTISKFWKTYDLFLVTLFTGLLGFTLFMHTKRQAKLMDLIYAWVYLFYGILIVGFGLINAPIFVSNLNNLNEFLRHGLMCDGKKEKLSTILWLGRILGNGQFILQIIIRAYLLWRTEDFERPLVGISRLVAQEIIHNIPFLFTFYFTTMCSVYGILFACFNTYLERALIQKKSILIHSEHLGQYTLSEHIDLARRMHERIRQSMMRFNRAFNPQLLIHLSIELLVIILHLYSVIVFYVVKSEDNETITGKANNVLNILFIVVHIVNLVLLLYASHKLKCRQTVPMDLLNMIRTEHLTGEEYAQLRLFSTKLQAIPVQIMAGRLFCIDLELIAPLMGSVVTYLLVALQFQWPAHVGGSHQMVYDNQSMTNLTIAGVPLPPLNPF